MPDCHRYVLLDYIVELSAPVSDLMPIFRAGGGELLATDQMFLPLHVPIALIQLFYHRLWDLIRLALQIDQPYCPGDILHHHNCLERCLSRRADCEHAVIFKQHGFESPIASITA